jgi:hypothetical protein
MVVIRGVNPAYYVGVISVLYIINIGNTQLLINVKNQVNNINVSTVGLGYFEVNVSSSCDVGKL